MRDLSNIAGDALDEKRKVYLAQIARLLAKENISVEHRSVQTAYFDTKNRVMVLPMWKNMSKDMYDLLTIHEVGHARFTPHEGWHNAVTGTEDKQFRNFLNVTEDARIEKKQKRDYPGARAPMIRAYNALHEADFFGVQELIDQGAIKSVADLGFIDRLNLHCKIGAAAGITFPNPVEADFVKRVLAAESFEETERVTREIYEYAKDENPEINWDGVPDPDESGEDEGEGCGQIRVPEPGSSSDDSEDGDDSESSSSSSDAASDSSDENGSESEAGDAGQGDGEGDTSGGESDSEENAKADKGESAEGETQGEKTDSPDVGDGGSISDSDGEPAPNNESGKRIGGGHEPALPRSLTEESFRDKMDDMVDDNPNREAPVYAKVPKKFNLDAAVITAAELLEIVDDHIEEHAGRESLKYSSIAIEDRNPAGFRRYLRERSKEICNNSKNVVNYLAKQFETKKAADSYLRASTSRTGVLDSNKLHNYRTSEDLFKRITVVPDGKNHGLVMVIDFSGSMSGNLASTVDQLINLVLFCRRVAIPFEVYTFTDGYFNWRSQLLTRGSNRSSVDDESGKPLQSPPPLAEPKAGDMVVGTYHLTMLQLITSDLRAEAFNKALDILVWIRDSNTLSQRSNTLFLSRVYSLRGTPLSDAILATSQIVKNFRKRHKLQVVNVAFLTDGEGYNLCKAYKLDDPKVGVGLHEIVVSGRRRDGGFQIMDPETGKTYTVDEKINLWQNPQSFTNVMFQILKDRTGVKIAGFFLADPGATRIKREIALKLGLINRRTGGWDDSPGCDQVISLYQEFKKNKAVALDVAGYDEFFLMEGGSALIIEEDTGLDDELTGAKVATIRRAFVKNAKNKLTGRVVLGRFIDMIAT